MGLFADLLKQAKTPSEKQWVEYLVDAHRDAPGMTQLAFAAHKTTEGLNSYEVLAQGLEKLPADAKLLDLACGDGFLIPYLLKKLTPKASVLGVDMSDAELQLARTSLSKLTQVSFHEGMAHAIPRPDKSFDAILCHMAFMLMKPVEPVVAELARLLKAGGVFRAVVGNPRKQSGIFKEIQKISFQFIESRYPGVKSASLGDPRVNHPEGLNELFSSELGFATPKISDFTLKVKLTPEGVWDFMKSMYLLAMQTEEERNQVRQDLIKFASEHVDPDGLLRFDFQMALIDVKKAV